MEAETEPTEQQRIFAACAPGMEPILATELAGLGLEAWAVAGGAEAAGEDAVALACIGSRVADSVVLRLYAGPHRGLAPALAASRRRFGRSAEIALRRDRDLVTASLDAVGGPLYKRGWRARVGAAPLRESLAAGVLLAAGYDGSQPFLDPMCGSGTLALEAAGLAARRAPGLGRSFAFEAWPGHDAARTASVRARLAALERAPPAAIHGSDRNAGAVRLAQKNAAAAGLEAFVRFERRDAATLSPPPGPGVLAVNPPYGLRLPDEVATAWRALASLLDRLPGWTVAVLAPDRPLRQLSPREPTRTVRVRNGGLACRLAVFDGL